MVFCILHIIIISKQCEMDNSVVMWYNHWFWGFHFDDGIEAFFCWKVFTLFWKWKWYVVCRKSWNVKKLIVKIGCTMGNSARHAFKNKRKMQETLKNDVFQPFFEASKTTNHRFSLYNLSANLLTTPYCLNKLVSGDQNLIIELFVHFLVSNGKW